MKNASFVVFPASPLVHYHCVCCLAHRLDSICQTCAATVLRSHFIACVQKLIEFVFKVEANYGKHYSAYPGFEQRFHRLGLVVHRGQMQRCVAALVPAVHLELVRRVDRRNEKKTAMKRRKASSDRKGTKGSGRERKTASIYDRSASVQSPGCAGRTRSGSESSRVHSGSVPTF